MSDDTSDLELEPADSPCQLVCSMERESGLCFGCGRTQEEISYWTMKSDEERQAILAELPARMLPLIKICLLYTSPSPRDATLSRMPSSA